MMHDHIHIIGGGLQGCFFTIALLEQAGIDRSRLHIWDKQERLLARWLWQSKACGMSYLRSSSSHSIHPDFNHLRDFARSRGIDLWNSAEFSQPYHRPSIALFNEHANACIENYGLLDLHIRQNVDRLQGGDSPGLYSGGEFFPGTVLFAGGFQQAGPKYPSWHSALQTKTRRIRHIFAEPMPTEDHSKGELIIGGGISAWQYAIDSARKGFSPLLISRRPAEIYRFDFNPCFIGPKCRPDLVDAQLNGGPGARLELILRNRYSGTIPREIYSDYMELVHSGNAGFETIQRESSFPQRLNSLEQDIVYCTGFERPLQQDWTEFDFENNILNGYPLPDENLQLCPGVYLSGASAMYRLGPAAPNLIGAHLAWRILKHNFM